MPAVSLTVTLHCSVPHTTIGWPLLVFALRSCHAMMLAPRQRGPPYSWEQSKRYVGQNVGIPLPCMHWWGKVTTQCVMWSPDELTIKGRQGRFGSGLKQPHQRAVPHSRGLAGRSFAECCSPARTGPGSAPLPARFSRRSSAHHAR